MMERRGYGKRRKRIDLREVLQMEMECTCRDGTLHGNWRDKFITKRTGM